MLAVLAAAGCVIGVALMVAAMGGAAEVHGGALAIVVGWLLVLASGATAYGLWTLSWWSWPLAVFAWVYGGTQALVSLANGTIDTGLVVAPIAIIYLLTPDIRAAFGTRVATPGRRLVAATVALALLPIVMTLAGSAMAAWRPTVPDIAGSTPVAHVDLGRVAAVRPSDVATLDEATVVAADCVAPDQRSAGWLDLCWSVMRQPDVDPAGDYYRFEVTGRFGAETAGPGDSPGSGVRWLVLRNELLTPVVDGVSSAVPDGVIDGCDPQAVDGSPGLGSRIVAVPCDGHLVGDATLQTHTVTWTCTDCLLGTDPGERTVQMAEDVKVAEGVLPSWNIYADFGH